MALCNFDISFGHFFLLGGCKAHVHLSVICLNYDGRAVKMSAKNGSFYLSWYCITEMLGHCCASRFQWRYRKLMFYTIISVLGDLLQKMRVVKQSVCPLPRERWLFTQDSFENLYAQNNTIWIITSINGSVTFYILI